MAQKMYDVPAEKMDNLRDCFYNVESFKSIMTELIRTNTNTELYPMYDEFRKHYKEALLEYDKAKIDFEFDYVKMLHPDAIAWDATFGDNKVLITYP